MTITALADGSNRYTIKRGLKQNPLLLTSDGSAINTVDLDRGTFLPLDAYSSLEIEAIADEALGDKRRNLLDELLLSWNVFDGNPQDHPTCLLSLMKICREEYQRRHPI